MLRYEEQKQCHFSLDRNIYIREEAPMCDASSFPLVRSLVNSSSSGQSDCAKSIPSIYAVALFVVSLGIANAQVLTWTPQGPAPVTGGQVEGIADREVDGAINAVAPHPNDANVVYAGAVNGGIWKTTNAMDPNPSWVNQTDDKESLSIGALEFDPTDATAQTLIAGIGRYSSFAGFGGARTGLLRTTDGGASWTEIDGGGVLDGANISGVAPRGSTIVASVNTGTLTSRGIMRSTDTGATWTQISGTSGTNLPSGRSFDLASDPSNPSRLFTNAGSNGIYRSTSTGATWTKVSDAAMDAMIASANNVEIVVGTANNVYVAVVIAGRLAGVFRSGDGGTSWVEMDLPQIPEGGIHPGGQGGLHLSIAADPSNANVVYVGGDRQTNPFPNSIGAMNFSGILFRGDASQPSGSQFVHLTHSNSLGPTGGGTASGSSPHADSRDMDIDANGDLIEGDDGGIYRRTNPLNNTGDWFSMNGNMQVTEFHSIAWDAVSNIVIGGAQDNDTPQQEIASDSRWSNVSSGDGGAVAVDDSSAAGLSTRYSSWQNLGAFRRRVYDASNTLISTEFPSLTVIGGGAPLVRQFVTPIKLNHVDATRMIIGGSNSVYESLDRGDTLTEIGPGIGANGFGRNPIAYGARSNADILYVGSGSQVFIRTGPTPAPLVASTAYPGTGFVAGITVNPGIHQIAFVVDHASVYQTTNAGNSWTDVTGNLQTLSPGTLRTIAYNTSSAAGAIVVGSDTGVFIASGPDFDSWGKLGSGLPTVPIFELDYDEADEVLVAGTLGRGAWTLQTSQIAPGKSGWTDDGSVVRLTTGSDSVGIGTMTPVDKLEVEGGQISVDGSGAVSAIRFRQSDEMKWALLTDASTGGDDFAIRNEAANSDVMTFDSVTNNVGIGTASPVDRFEIEGGQFTIDGAGALAAIRVRQNDALRWTFLTAPWIGDEDFRLRNEGTGRDVMTFDRQSDNVGIGTNSPGRKLSVENPSHQIRLTGQGPNGIELMDNDGTAGLNILYRTAPDELRIEKGTGEILFSIDRDSSDVIVGNGSVVRFNLQNLHNTHPTLAANEFGIAWNQSGGRGETVFYQHGGAGWRSGYDFWTERNGAPRRLQARIEDTGHMRIRGDYKSLSDAREKTNITEVTDALDKVQKLRGVYFDWTDKESRDEGRHVGLIAQEVATVVPEIVGIFNEAGDGQTLEADARLYDLNYDGLIPILIEAIQEQQQMIDALSERIARLESNSSAN